MNDDFDDFCDDENFFDNDNIDEFDHLSNEFIHDAADTVGNIISSHNKADVFAATLAFGDEMTIDPPQKIEKEINSCKEVKTEKLTLKNQKPINNKENDSNVQSVIK